MSGPAQGWCTGVGVVTVAFCALVRTVAAVDPMPVWSMDPLSMWVPPAGIGPVMLMALDLVGILGAALILLAQRARVRPVPTALLLIGAAGVMLHAARSPGDAETGLPWVFAVAGGFAFSHLPRDSMWRSVALASVFSLALMMVGRGLLQILVEHPQTVASYKATRDAFLESQGWSPDSMMARNYERRLFQAEASGWFGLANVYGSVMAAMALGTGVIAWVMFRKGSTDRRVPIALLTASALCGTALALSGSKGAIGAALLALVVLAAATRMPKRAPVIIALVPAAVLLGVVARGLIGERIGELSILFRWFYMQGATRVFLEHPLSGVGPAGFKDAYLLAKPPTSPEEVTSAHNLLFDWLAMLGVFAFAWIGLFALACRGAGGAIAEPVDEAGSPAWSERAAVLAAGGIMAAVIGASAFLERILVTPEMGIVRAVGLLGGLAIAAAVIRAAREHARAVDLGAVASAAVLLGHTQIEVTGVWAASAPLGACLVGLAVRTSGGGNRGRSGIAAAVGLVAVVVVAASTSGRTIARWDAALGHASAAVEPVGSAMSALQTAEAGSRDQLRAAEAIAALADRPTARDSHELAAQIDAARSGAIEAALPGLLSATAIRPAHIETRQQAVRMLLRRAEMSADGPTRDAGFAEAVLIARAGTEAAPDRAGSWRLLASTLTAGAENGLAGPHHLEQAYQALIRAAELDPHGLPTPLNLVELADRLGLQTERRAWAARALAIDADLRLDPLKRLTDEQRAALERVASGG